MARCLTRCGRCPSGCRQGARIGGGITLKGSLACFKPGGLACLTGRLAESWSILDFAPIELMQATVGLTIYASEQVTAPGAAWQAFPNYPGENRGRPPADGEKCGRCQKIDNHLITCACGYLSKLIS